MKLYHISNTLKLQEPMSLDFNRQSALAEPFTQALERSRDCFYGTFYAAKYLRAVLRKSGMREWSNHVKWATEGAFEYIRKTEFSACCCRLRCNYFFDSLAYAKELYEEDWGSASEEERLQVRLYEVALEDEAPRRLDMRLFDEAFGVMSEDPDLERVLDAARRYFSGAQTARPMWELLSDRPARAVADLTGCLR